MWRGTHFSSADYADAKDSKQKNAIINSGAHLDTALGGDLPRNAAVSLRPAAARRKHNDDGEFQHRVYSSCCGWSSTQPRSGASVKIRPLTLSAMGVQTILSHHGCNCKCRAGFSAPSARHICRTGIYRVQSSVGATQLCRTFCVAPAELDVFSILFLQLCQP